MPLLSSCSQAVPTSNALQAAPGCFSWLRPCSCSAGGGALTAITAYPSPDGATTMLALGFLAGKVQMTHLPHNSRWAPLPLACALPWTWLPRLTTPLRYMAAVPAPCAFLVRHGRSRCCCLRQLQRVNCVHAAPVCSDLVPSWSSRPPLADSHNTGPQCNTDDLLGSPAVRHLVLLKASLRMHNLAVVHDNGAVQLLRDNGGQPCRAYLPAGECLCYT